MKNKKNRFADCNHCFKEYNQVKSNQKFCSTSCRVASHNMNKDKNIDISGLKKTELPAIANPKTFNEYILELTKLLAPSAVENLIKTLRGINNSDLSKKLDQIILSQKALDKIIKNQNVLISKIDSLIEPDPPSNFNVMN
jgi:hypothetical protein